mgnify:CR=1 FL=1
MTKGGANDELVFLALGGAGEIGMNLYLYGYGPAARRRWMMVDLGITFGDDSRPGVDVMMPDPAFIEERRDRLDGLVLTHAHEDHLGAVPYLWDRLRCPIFATPFTASILRRKLSDTGFEHEARITEIPLSGRFTVGPFDLELITLTHSIPEPNAIAIRTPAGLVLHTGDWKFDPDPVIGPAADEDALRRLGDEGTLAMVCDSTNIFTPGVSGSEADLLESLSGLIGTCKKKVVVTCFASNVARLKTISRAARSCGRDVVAAGRSLRRFEAAARENGYLDDTPAFIDERDLGHLPDGKALIICTGSQGEPRAALARIASGDHPNVTLERGDTVIFSSKIIPGNELSIARLHNDLVRRGIELMTEMDHFVHVSGHPARGELARMYRHVRPEIAVPIHGEIRHLVENSHLAGDCQVAHTVVSENGGMIRLGPGPARVIDHVRSGRLALDGERIVPLEGELFRERKRTLWNGHAVVSLAIDGRGRLAAAPQLTATGLFEEGSANSPDGILAAVDDALAGLGALEKKKDDVVGEAVRIAVRRAFRKIIGKNPVISVHLIRL